MLTSSFKNRVSLQLDWSFGGSGLELEMVLGPGNGRIQVEKQIAMGCAEMKGVKGTITEGWNWKRGAKTVLGSRD